MHLRYIRRYSIFAALCLITWFVWSPGRRVSKISETIHGPLSSKPSFDFNRTVEIRHSLGVVGPCDIGILLGIERAFLATRLTVGELTLACLEEEIEVFTSFVDQTFSGIPMPVKIVQVPPKFPLEFYLLIAASNSPHQEVLILDSISILHANSLIWIQEAVSQVEATQLPAGPCGWQILPSPEGDLFAPMISGHDAAFLSPPFLVDPEQVYNAINGLPNHPLVWSSFAARTSAISNTSAGGRVTASPSFLCPIDLAPAKAFPLPKIPAISQSFVATLTNLDHLLDFQDSLCRLASQGHAVRAILFTEPEYTDSYGWSRGDSCYLHYDIWESSKKGDIFVSITDIGIENGRLHTVLLVSSDLMASLVSLNFLNQKFLPYLLVVVPLTRLDLKHSMWMTTLTTHQWENWNRVTLDLSVITNNRPLSLSRLLRSLNGALYFGHSDVHLTIYMEQTADPETKKTVQEFDWRHGKLTVRHRVIKGGLIPAIVESWYPTTNDTYGLILEDDIELSPMYFAWAQMTILRYRYDESASLRLQLYGISLYQPKNVELRPEGRRPWSAQELFRDAGLPFPRSPYLSATPCSWGAIYFPEHWREFHDYLIARMSEQYLSQNHLIVPDVRSNRWQRSWKKFFIEFQFLRGYVMLYPNYDNFISYSTNHLELGSHVSPAKAKAKAEFIVPLMPLEDSASMILQLPAEELPALASLPVVDLHGYLSSADTLQIQGEKKRAELCDCEATPGGFNASELLCSS